MTRHDDHRQENEALRGRISRLSAAILRINTSLDLDVVLREAVESARALTGAAYSVITTIDDAAQPQDFVTSGFTAEEHRLMEDWPDEPRLFERLGDLPATLRVADLADYVRSLGYCSHVIPSTTFQAAPMRHRDVHVGSFFLGGKEGGRESRTRTKRSWCCSRRRRRRRSSTPARTAPSSARARTWRP